MLSVLSWSSMRAGAADRIAEARSLYAAAAYEDTLALLTTLDDPTLADQVDEYRALCFLALNREAEATQTMESIVRRHPLRLDDIEARSPKFATLYRGVQTRMLPGLALERYGVAKRAYDAGDFAAAARQFTNAVELLRASGPGGSQASLELLAAGFLALSERRASGALAAPVLTEPEHFAVRGGSGLTAQLSGVPLEPAPEPATPPRVEAPLFAPVPRVYSAEDRDVTPPSVIEQKLPIWRPPNGALLGQTLLGRLRILIDVDGRVIDAEILKTANAVYDDQLLRSISQWRYQPATKRGYPVQYRRVVDYTLRPPAEIPR